MVVPACRKLPGATGNSSYCGYVGPFKAHPNSVNMAVEPMGAYLWNGYPNMAMPMDMGGDMGGYGYGEMGADAL
jgi:hypothetical protein